LLAFRADLIAKSRNQLHYPLLQLDALLLLRGDGQIHSRNLYAKPVSREKEEERRKKEEERRKKKEERSYYEPFKK
jgi:hypothetical protein